MAEGDRSKKLFLPSGYLDMDYIIEKIPTALVLICGGRGAGKTYGALNYVRLHPNAGTIFLRITDVEHDLISDPKFSPFMWHNMDFGCNIQPYRIRKGFAEWCESEYSEEGRIIPKEKSIMTSTSLTQMSNVRGFSGADLRLLLFDEFIPERGKVNRMKDDSFANAYETINRNRELMGIDPLKAILLSNSNQLDNPVFRGFHLVEKAEQMKKKGQILSIMKDRELTLMVLPETDIGKKKRNTALYKAMKGTEFADMALNNDFAYDKPSQIESRSLKGFTSIFNTKEFSVFSNADREYYVTIAESFNMKEKRIGDSMPEIMRARKKFEFVWLAYMAGKVYFESYALEIKFRKFYLDNIRTL